MKTTALRIIIGLLLLPMISMTIKAQGTPFNWNTNIGIYGGANINMQQPSFELLNPAATFDKNSTDIFINAGLIGNFPVSDLITISARLGYNGFRGILESDEHKLETKLNYFEVNPNVQFHNLIGNSPLYFFLGPELGIPISAEYDRFTNGVKENLTDNEIPDKNFRLAAALGLGYIFKLGSNTYFTPEASFRLPFTKVSKDNAWDSWTAPQVRVGFALSFGFGKKEKPEEIVVPGVELEVGFREVRYYDKERNPHPLRKITVEETQYSELFPLVPYVFFREGTAQVNQITNLQGRRQAGEFSIKELPADAMLINSQVLDIVGTRMQENPNARITLTGTFDNQSERETSLSQERANFAKNYLVNNFKIDGSRIDAVAGRLPARPSTSRVSDGVEENRRVEITTTNNDILAPIMLESDRQRLADPDLVEFVVYANSNEEIAGWELEIKQAGKSVRKMQGTGEPEPIKWNIIPNELSASQVPLDYTFTARTVSGASKSASASVPVEFFSFTRKKTEDKADRTIAKYSLTLFDFDSPNVSASDRAILDQYVVPQIKFNSTVQIYGYTDRIGDANYNQKLARERAEAVKKYLESKVRNAKYEIFGVGENEIIFDNNNPVGRHLSRTVQIYVTTPKQ